MKNIIPILVGCITAIFLLTGCKSPEVISETVKDDEIEETVEAYRSVIVEVQTGTEKAQPAIEEAQAAIEEVQPVIEEVQPTIEEVQPVIEEVQPAIEEVQPVIEDVTTRRPEPESIIGYYSVQVGAFTDALNANNALRKIRQRFDLEAQYDYDSVEQLYKVTIGRFAEYEYAQTFRDRIMRDYPGEYIDAWIVDMAQRKYETKQ